MKSKQFKVIAVLVVIAGSIFGIVLGFTCQITTYSVWYDSHKEYAFNIGLMLETWILFGLLGLFFGWLASVLNKLENIEAALLGKEIEDYESIQEIKNFANKAKEKIAKQYVAIKGNNQQVAQTTGDSLDTAAQNDEIWYCPNCGKRHQGDTNICDCGTKKP